MIKMMKIMITINDYEDSDYNNDDDDDDEDSNYNNVDDEDSDYNDDDDGEYSMIGLVSNGGVVGAGL